MKQNRRTFIKVTSLASATLVPVVGTLAQVLGKKEEDISINLGGHFNEDFEFHIIDNNLLNLHFYFINAKKSGSAIVPASEDGISKSFMIVRLPQMHISEKGYWYDDWNDSKNKLPNAKLSGYSYLAFHLWPGKSSENEKASQKKKLNFTLENILNWNDEINFELITLVEWLKIKEGDTFQFSDYTKCNDFNKQKVWHLSNDEVIKEFADDTYYVKNIYEPTNTFNYKKYKSLIRHFLDQNLKPSPKVNNFIPITFLEFPQGAILVPIARDENGDLATVDKRIKQFWKNKFVNQKEVNFGYRKYEVWNNTLFYKTKTKAKETSNEKTFKIETPSFRIAGLITDKNVPCPDVKEKTCDEANTQGKEQSYLPSLLDKTELTFLTQFAKGEKGTDYEDVDFTDKKFDIKEVNGLFFTGLGIITHLKYYNEDVPKGIDLIEYEHIITEGRDIFIKVARIGIHNKNGKRYKHVIEGKRKIETEIRNDETEIIYSFPDGATSFIELKQYCECLEMKKVYEFSDEDIASWNESDFDIPTFDTQSKEYFAPVVANKPHFRRFTWKEIRTIEKKRIPIETYQDKSDGTPINIPNPKCALWFWPVHEGTLINPKYLHSVFDADDWDKEILNLSTPFIFIRKSVFEEEKIDGVTTDDIKKQIADSYFQHTSDEATNPANLRRKVIINNQKIAFTKPLPAKDTSTLKGQALIETLNESKNKTHILETDFIEPYFNLIQRSKITTTLPFKKIRFPLLPQVLRAKVFIDHIKDLAQDKIPSVVQYHEDYLYHVFDDYSKSGNIVLGNGAKLILKNTLAFKNEIEEPLNNTYQKISNALNEAKDRLGNLAVPDIIPESISLEKLGITAPANIRKSIEEGRTVLTDASAQLQKIASFNPRELLRGKLSDVCGLDLTSILDELIPADSSNNQTPLFEINKIANKVSDAITNSEVFKDINSKLVSVKKEIADREIEYQNLKIEIEAKRLEYNSKIKQITKIIPNADDIRNILKTEYENLRTKAFNIILEDKYFNKAKDEIELSKDLIKNHLQGEISILKDLCLEKHKELESIQNDILFEINNIEKEVSSNPIFNDWLANLKIITTKKYIENIVSEYQKHFVDKKLVDLIRDIDNDFTKPLTDTTNDNNPLRSGMEDYINLSTFDFEAKDQIKIDRGIQIQFYKFNDFNVGYIQTKKKVDDFKLFIAKNISGNSYQNEVAKILQSELLKYNTQLDLLGTKTNSYTGIPDGVLYKLSENINTWLRNYESSFLQIESHLEGTARDSITKIKSLLSRTNPYIDLLRKLDPNFYYNERSRIDKELIDVKRRIEQLNLKDYNEFINSVAVEYSKVFISTNAGILSPYEDYIKAIIDFENNLIDNQILNSKRQKYIEIYKIVIDNLSKKPDEYLRILVNNNPDVRELYEEASKAKLFIMNKEKYYDELLKTYRQFVTDNITIIESSLYDKIDEYIVTHPNEIEKVNDAKNLYRLLTSIKQQDLTYNWNTTSFRDINLGIVSFKKFSNPDTTLKVDVKATTYFTSGKFPPAIERVVTYSENKFTNFGISFFNSLTVSFNEISFIAGSDHSTHFDVKIKDVKFDGALSFVQAFESWLQTMGKGLILQLHGDHVALGYSFAIPAIKTPGFNIFNLSLNFDLRVYFDKRPLRVGFSLARPDSKFGIAVGIYAGFGFFGIVADPKKGIVEIDCALEAGAWAGISIGPISGEVKLAFGFRYTKNEFGVRIEGYIVAEGRLTVWILEVSARIYLGVVSENSYVEGVCTVTYSVKLGFISKSFSGSFHKRIAGASSNNSGEQATKILSFHSNVASKFGVSNLNMNNRLHPIMTEVLDSYQDDEDEIETNPVSIDSWKQFITVF